MNNLRICIILLCVVLLVCAEPGKRRGKNRRRNRGRTTTLAPNTTALEQPTDEDINQLKANNKQGVRTRKNGRQQRKGKRGKGKGRRNRWKKKTTTLSTTIAMPTTTAMPTTVVMTTESDDVTTHYDITTSSIEHDDGFSMYGYDVDDKSMLGLDRSDTYGNFTHDEFNSTLDRRYIEEDEEEEGPTLPPVHPGFKGRITQHGMDYVSQVANSLMARELQKLKIPDQEEEIGPAYVQIKDIHVSEFPVPSSRMYTLPGLGIRLETRGIEPTILADYEAEMTIAFWRITKSGSMKVKGSDIYFILDFFIGRDNGGKPTIEVVECEADGDISISFEGGWSDILNTGSSLFKNNIRSLIMAQLCSQIQNEINTNTAWALQQFEVSEVFEEEYEIDFHLVKFPSFTREAMEIFLKGSVYLLTNGTREEPPFEPQIIPDYPEHTSRMVYVYITSYLLNSGLYAAYHGGKMGGNVTQDMLPEEAREYLTTSCPDGICLGSVFPQIAKQYPNSDVAVSLYASQLPWVKFKKGAVQLYGAMAAEVFVVADEKQHFLFKADVNVSAEFEIKLEDKNITFLISKFEPVAQIASSQLSDPTFNFFFDTMAKLATQKFLKPKLAEYGEKGFVIPDLKDVRFLNPQIIIDEKLEDVIIISSDVYYDGPL